MNSIKKLVYIKLLQGVKLPSIFMNLKDNLELKNDSLNRANNLQLPKAGKQQHCAG